MDPEDWLLRIRNALLDSPDFPHFGSSYEGGSKELHCTIVGSKQRFKIVILEEGET